MIINLERFVYFRRPYRLMVEKIDWESIRKTT